MKSRSRQGESGDVSEARTIFERITGISSVPAETVRAGTTPFLKFVVGRDAPLYEYALLETQKHLSETNAFAGTLGLATESTGHFPSSLESRALLTLLTRSTKEIAEGSTAAAYSVPYVPFQGREDHQLAQPANHIVRGRRGVGKSTLIKRARQLLADTGAIVTVLDMQPYSSLVGDDLIVEVCHDICKGLADAANAAHARIEAKELEGLADRILAGSLPVARIPINVKRSLGRITKDQRQAFVFLDDFHLLESTDQPRLLDILAGALKGANGWLKVAGLASRLRHYDPGRMQGLQVPGDAQYIALDLTLTDPEGAEAHLKRILEGFLNAVGYTLANTVIPEAALKRLVWANAGVPRDFLQMFARSLEHAQRNRHSAVTLSDVNMAIGEFGQQKMEELEKDARNDAGMLRETLQRIEGFCLGENKVIAFLVRSEESKERDLVRALTDLRMIHLIHRSITPSRAGERYEAYILDYSIFTGFRKRRNIREMLPTAQFRASELRALPRINPGFLDGAGANQSSQADDANPFCGTA